MENVPEVSASSQAPKGLVRKLCEVIAATGYVEKSGTNQKQGYKYVTEADVLAMLRKELAARNVFVFPSVLSTSRTELYKTQSGNTMYITDVVVRWTFLDGDTGEVYECEMPGSGTDTGDKGLYKAITGSSKYMFLKGFMLPTGDDPEDEKIDHGEGVAAAKAVAEKKLADYAQKSAAQVKGKTIEYYPHKFGDVDAVVFLPSESLAVMMDNGLNDITQSSPTLKARWIVDDPEPLAILEKIAAQLSITCKRVNPPSQTAPTAKYQAPPPSRPDSFPILHKAEVMKGKKGQYLAVVWGETKASCFKQHLWEALQAGAGAKQQANLKTEMNGAYTNIVDIYQIGEREYLEGEPLRRTDDVGPMKFF